MSGQTNGIGAEKVCMKYKSFMYANILPYTITYKFKKHLSNAKVFFPMRCSPTELLQHLFMHFINGRKVSKDDLQFCVV
jgi:hypothetical protein